MFFENGFSGPVPVRSARHADARIFRCYFRCARGLAFIGLTALVWCLSAGAGQADTIACPASSASAAGVILSQRVDLAASSCSNTRSVPTTGVLISLDTAAAEDATYRITLRIKPKSASAMSFTCASVTPVLSSSYTGSFVFADYDLPIDGAPHHCSISYMSGGETITVPVETHVEGTGSAKNAALRATSFDPSGATGDTIAPRITALTRHSPGEALVSTGPLTWQIVFDEDVQNVSADDFTLSGSTAALSVTPVSASLYRITASGGDLNSRNGVVSLGIAAGQDIADLAENALADTGVTGTDDPAYTIDSTAPAATIMSNAAPRTNLAVIPLEIVFTEPVTGFEAGDLLVSGGAITGFSGSDARYEADLTPDGDGMIHVDLPEDVAEDLVGLGNTAAAQITLTSDRTAPVVTLAISVADLSNSAQIPVTIGLSEAGVTPLAASDIVVSGGSVADFTGSGTRYGFDLVPGGDGLIRAEIAADTVVDAAGNGNQAVAVEVTSDRSAPRLSAITRDNPALAVTNADSLTWQVRFSEPVTGVDATDFAVTGSTATAEVTALAADLYELHISGGDLAVAEGEVRVDLAVGQDITDLPGNALGNLTATGVVETYLLDNTAPGGGLSGLPLEVSGPVVITIGFDEPVTGFGIADITIGNGTLSGFSGSGDSYQVTASPGAGDDLALSVAAGVAMDAAGNPNLALAEISAPLDRSPPGVTLTGMPDYLTGPVTLTVTFSEPVTGFGQDGFQVSPSTLVLSGFSAVSAQSYRVTATPDPGASGLVSVSVAADSAQDLAGNGNTASDPVSGRIDLIAPRLTGVTRVGPALSNADSLTWALVFSEDVTGLDSAVIRLTGTTAALTSVQNISPQTYHLTFAGGDLPDLPDAVVALDLVDLTGVSDAAGNGLTGAAPAGSYEVQIDNRPPEQIEARYHDPTESPTRADSLTWEVVFDEAVTGLSPADFAVTGSSATIRSVDPVQADRARVQVSGGDLAGLTGTVTLGFAPGADIRDGAGNVLVLRGLRHQGTGAGGADWQLDNAAPRISASSATSDPFAAGEMLVTLEFSKPVVVPPATPPGVQISNGSLAGITYPDSRTARIRITPNGAGQVQITVPAAAFQDSLGQGSEGPVSLARRYDPEAPRLAAITRTTPASSPARADQLIWDLVFSEAVSAVDAADFVLSGSSASLSVAVQSSTQARVTAAGGDLADVTGRVVLDFAAGRSITDAAGNPLLSGGMDDHLGAPENWVDLDHTAPSVVISSPAPDPGNGAGLPVTIRFSEPVTGFDAGDLTVGNGRVSGFSGSGDSYDLTLEPMADGQVSLNIAAGVAEDGAGNLSLAAPPFTRQSDRTAPTPVLSGLPAILSGPVPVTIGFSEPVTGFEIDDITLAGGTLSAFSGSGDSYRVTVTPGADGATLRMQVQGAAATDAAGNASTASAEISAGADLLGPTVEIIGLPALFNGAVVVTLRFSEAVTGLTGADLVAGNADLSGLTGGGAVYQVTVTPRSDGPVTLALPADAVADAGGHGNTASTGVEGRADLTRPEPVFSGMGPVITGPVLVHIRFSEPVTGFGIGDLTSSNATLSDFSGSAAEYSVQVTPLADGAVTLRLAGGLAHDPAGNGNRSGSLESRADLTAPVISVSGLPALIGGPVRVAIGVSEPVTGFGVEDLNTENASLSGFSGTGASYEVTLTPLGDGAVVLHVAADRAHDASGLGNQEARVAVTADLSPPSVTLSGTPPSPATLPYTLTVRFSEPVSGLDPGDFLTVDADLSGLAGAIRSIPFR
ncbi:hypothetical protein E2K80_04210 [Rhodophyticola sp. CCM32]|uniref:Ig-like domain-containing protein n=1 Tax=Rhodophyticola sp. CCM32 TaxID=2916397 RepID=UPI00107F0BF9|nr:Ig-like domain-containing protein [Rhodophyticola sp. CCM32]QBY00041.1 hypothetical protein E2K80_04210 [Rhodophyticola sp. CCM32]